MLKKIQQYLLINYPLLWNTKIMPMLLYAILANLLAFLVGYFGSYVNFKKLGEYNYSADLGYFYFFLTFITLLILILWIVFYFKNNAFNSYYPKSSKSIYLEWLIIFFIILSSSIAFLSMNAGSILKQRSYASKQDAISAMNTLDLVRVLVPSNKYEYYKETPNDDSNTFYNDYAAKSPNQNREAVIVESNTLSEPVFYNDDPNFVQFSLLNYHGISRYNYTDDIPYQSEKKPSDRVLTLLKAQDKEAIEKIISNFLVLQKKHKLKSNIDKDQWMQLVYNPSKYPIGNYNLISSRSFGDDIGSTKSFYDNFSGNYYNYEYYVSFDDLDNGYSKILRAYDSSLFDSEIMLVILCISGVLSFFVFSYRLTSGKSWLIAFISFGLICIFSGIFSSLFMLTGSSGFAPFLSYLGLLILLLVVELYLIISKNSGFKPKGRSDIYMNHILWLLPLTPVFIVMVIYNGFMRDCFYNDDYSELSTKCDIYYFIRDHIVGLLYANVALTFVTVWLYVQFVVLKWKGLPEE